MNFQDRGIIIAKNNLKETSSVVTVLTEKYGLYSGLVRKPKKSNTGNVIFESNLVDFFWRARLDEHLGFARCELIRSFNLPIMMDKTKLYAFNAIVNIIRIAFCERESHNNFFNKLLNFLEKITKLDITNDELFIEYIKLELALLSETGHQLQLDSCVAEGDANNLYYVSPKSGHAVSYKKGKPYENKLLILPEFLKRKVTITTKQKKEAIALTSYFLTRYIFHKKYEPYSRRVFIKCILQQEATVK
ncbi:MAG: DNA repair protein RecO [Rickettsiaceae bacterium]|nr:DNA repair protein RecO [Rickettsiaceae bacterium]